MVSSVGRIDEEMPSEMRWEKIKMVVTIQKATIRPTGVKFASYWISIIATMAKPAMREETLAEVCSLDLANFSSVHAERSSGDVLM